MQLCEIWGGDVEDARKVSNRSRRGSNPSSGIAVLYGWWGGVEKIEEIF